MCVLLLRCVLCVRLVYIGYPTLEIKFFVRLSIDEIVISKLVSYNVSVNGVVELRNEVWMSEANDKRVRVRWC